MALPSVAYTPRDPAGNVRHRVVRDHLQTLLAEAAYLRDGEGVPRFVEKQCQAFLTCGWRAAGFARFRCGACGVERLVAFSCARAEGSVRAGVPGARTVRAGVEVAVDGA